MVIIAVSKFYPKIDTNEVLGAHKWNDFLKSPRPDERDRESRIYHSTFRTGREVQKSGKCAPFFMNLPLPRFNDRLETYRYRGLLV